MTITDDVSDPVGPIPAFNGAHGHAALLLVESLIHGFCEISVLTTAQATDIVERAISIQLDHAVSTNSANNSMWRAHTLLMSIAASLRIDDDRYQR